MRKLILSAAAAAAVMAGGSAYAVPTLVITVTDTGVGGGSVSCSVNASIAGGTTVCSGAGYSFTSGLSNSAGNLTFIFQGGVGGYSLEFSSTQTNSPGTSFEAVINNSYTNVHNKSSNGSLVVSLAAYDFTLPAGPALTLFGSQAQSSNSNNPGTISSNYYASSANAVNASTAPSATTSCSFGAAIATSCVAASQNFMNAGTFSLEDVVTFSLAQQNPGDGTSPVNGSSNLVVRNTVPEPMTTALVGLGLFGAAFFSRRRKALKA